MPVAFQDAIRTHFPLYERAGNPALQVLPPQLLQAMGSPGNATGFIFRTEDRKTAVTLTADALTVETFSYIRWRDFWAQATACIDVLHRVYTPAFVTRAGLRYQNMIRRESLELNSVPWSELLSRQLLGELADASWEQTAIESRHVIHCRDNIGDSVLLQHGFGQEVGHEQVYVIDFDYYSDERTTFEHLPNLFQRFNSRSGRAFRWAISDRLHSVLQPSMYET